MKILVVSDTHGDISGVQEALRREGPVDYVFHLGDNARDAARIQTTAHMVSVLGNCDFGGAPLTETVFLCGNRLLLTHGHGQGVKYGLQRLAYFAAEQEVDAAFFGHTHVPLIDYYGSILLMNPGSISRPRGRKPTYGVVELTDGFLKPDVRFL